jgi:imidazolonepropionase-like amidohydrolase
MDKTIFYNGLVIDGRGEAREKGWIICDGSVISEVGAKGEPVPEPGDSPLKRIDLEGMTLLPGLIDCHVHLSHDSSSDPLTMLAGEPDPVTLLKMVRNAENTLKAGFTTVRDLGGKGTLDMHLRDSVLSGIIRGPRILCAGRMICMTGGHGWPVGREADGVEGVRKAVRQQMKEGADVIKLMATGGVVTKGVDPGASQLTLEEMEAGIVEAHRAGRKTSAHAQGRDGIKNAVMAGIDSVEHGVFLDEELLEMMIEKGIFLVPTLSAPMSILRGGSREGLPAHMVSKTEAMADRHFESAGMAFGSRIRIAMGTDAGTPFNLHGRNAKELVYMVDKGLPEMNALISATSAAAELLGIEAETGSIEKGKRADMIIVKGDPLEDISCLCDAGNIRAVYKDGALVD